VMARVSARILWYQLQLAAMPHATDQRRDHIIATLRL
jgi:hypothetical protein